MANDSLGQLRRLCKKELLETLRDRRTIVTLIAMPVLLYPLLAMALNRFLLSGSADVEVGYRVAVPDEAQGRWLSQLLSPEASGPPESVRTAAGGGVAEFRIFIPNKDELSEDDVADGPATTLPAVMPPATISPAAMLEAGNVEVAAAIVFQPDAPEPDVDPTSGVERNFTARIPASITLIARADDPASTAARRILVERIQWYRSRFMESQLLARGYPPPSIEVRLDAVGSGAQPSMLATVVPLVLLLMTITGAVYPAIDLTAGERERGTMEPLMASPVPPIRVLIAKYVAVVTVALLTAVANMTAMLVTLWASGLWSTIAGQAGFSLGSLVAMFGLLVLFAGFFAAVLLALTSYARSFKEAQAYLIPVMLVSIAPGMMALLPGTRLDGPLAIAPLLNIVVLSRELLAGTATLAPSVVAIFSTIVYAAAAMAVAARLFGTDATHRTDDASIASLLRRPSNGSSSGRTSMTGTSTTGTSMTGATRVPAADVAAVTLAMLVPIYFVVSNALITHISGIKESMLGGGAELSLDEQTRLQIRSMSLSAISLILVFGGVPALMTWFRRLDVRSTYRIARPPVASLFAAALIGLGAWALAHEVFVWVDLGMEADRIEQLESVIKAWTQVPPWLMVLTLAATPAIVEELCFRGFLFSSLRRNFTAWQTIAISSLVFGLFHVITGNALLLERFIPTTLLGVLLGWIAYRSGSVLPGIVLHFVHNGLLNLVGHYHERITWLSDIDDTAHLPPQWIAGCTAIVMVGLAVVYLSTRQTGEPLAVEPLPDGV